MANRDGHGGAASRSCPWELARCAGDNELLLGDGEFLGPGVDTGTVGLVDAAAGTTVIVVFTGGDGSYPVWLGRATDESVSCFVVDMLALTDGGARPL